MPPCGTGVHMPSSIGPSRLEAAADQAPGGRRGRDRRGGLSEPRQGCSLGRMSIIEVAILIVVAGVCGAVGQFLSGYSRGGCPVSFVMGLVGAFFGPRVAAAMGWPEPLILPIGAVPFPVVSSVVGALVLVLIVNILTHKRKF